MAVEEGIVPEFVYNHDIAGLYDRFNRFLAEMNKSVSSATSQMNQFDQTRLTSYLNAVRAYHDWVINQPNLDLPETHPRKIALAPPVVRAESDSEIIQDIGRLMTLARDELVNSQSARDPANLNPFDSARLLAMVGKVEAYLTDYVTKATPLDLPESSPLHGMTGPGRGGVIGEA